MIGCLPKNAMKIGLILYGEEIKGIGNPLNFCMIKFLSVFIKYRINYVIKYDFVNLKLSLCWLMIIFRPY